MKVWLGFRKERFREPYLREACRKAMAGLGWAEVKRPEECELAIWWGIPVSHKPVMEMLKAKGIPFIIIDFAYWGRSNRHNIRGGYYKVSLNGLHPTDDLFRLGQDADRYRTTGGFKICPWQKGGESILVAGMGPKAASVFDIRHGEWDGAAVETLQRHTQRSIIYRQKPSDKYPIIFPGTENDAAKRPIAEVFRRCFAVVTHHGNSTVEALAAGIPGYTRHSVTREMGHTDLSLIESPFYPENREEFFYSLANWQWHFEEIAEGLPFRLMRQRGLLHG